MSGGERTIIAMMAVVALALVFSLFITSSDVVKEHLQECLAHQEWCFEHYQLEKAE